MNKEIDDLDYERKLKRKRKWIFASIYLLLGGGALVAGIGFSIWIYVNTGRVQKKPLLFGLLLGGATLYKGIVTLRRGEQLDTEDMVNPLL